MSSSYPFLALARHHRVPYGMVLSYADYVDSNSSYGVSITNVWQHRAIYVLPVHVLVDVQKVCKMPKHERRFPCV